MYFNLPRIFLLIISVFYLATFSYWICQQCLQTKLLNLHLIFSPSVVMFLFLWNNNCVTLWTTCVNYKWKTEHTQAQNMHAKKRTKPPIIKLFVPISFFHGILHICYSCISLRSYIWILHFYTKISMWPPIFFLSLDLSSCYYCKYVIAKSRKPL